MSLFASVTIIWKIFQSNTKLKAPYCRIIFGLSFYDVIFSCANIASTMPVPAVSSTYFGAIGNDITCSIQGIIFASAGGFMPFYNLSLCIYFYCIMNHSMTDDRFSRSVEPYLHAVPFVLGAFSAVYLSVNDYIHDTGYLCFIAAKSDEEMLSTRLVYIFNILPLTFNLCGIILIMGLITWIVWNQERRMNQYRFNFGIGSSSPSWSFFSRTNSANTQTSVLNSSYSERSQRNRSRGRDRVNSVQRQAYAFLGAFLLAFVPAYITFAAPNDDNDNYLDGPHSIVTLLAFTMYPLQGVFNLCAHLQPRVWRLRRRNTDLSYAQALKVAVLTFDDDMDRRASMPNSTRSIPRSLTNGTAVRRSSRHLESIGELPSTKRTQQWKMRLFRKKKSNEQRTLSVVTDLLITSDEEKVDECELT